MRFFFGDGSFGLSGLSGAEYRLREKRGKMLIWGSGWAKKAREGCELLGLLPVLNKSVSEKTATNKKAQDYKCNVSMQEME